jgi:FKBP-type peptidyl-prolyl cis-trans isomerase 2
MKTAHVILIGILLAGVTFITGCTVEQVETGDTVRVHYTGSLTDGTVFDTSVGSDPLEFTIGSEQVIPGFEQAVVGMKLGESKTVTIPAEEAYGPRYKEWVFAIDRDQLPEDVEPQVGSILDLVVMPNAVMTVIVIAVSETSVIVDANHPLAGQDLTFDIELVEIVGVAQ